MIIVKIVGKFRLFVLTFKSFSSTCKPFLLLYKVVLFIFWIKNRNCIQDPFAENQLHWVCLFHSEINARLLKAYLNFLRFSFGNTNMMPHYQFEFPMELHF